MAMSEVGTISHYFAWQPTIDHEKYTIDLRPMDGHWHDSGVAIVCIIGLADAGAEQIPKFSGAAWSTSPAEAQYYAFKQAAYLLTFGTLPPPIEVGPFTEYEDRINGRSEYNIRPEYTT